MGERNEIQKLLSRIIIATMITFTGTLSYQAIEQTHISHAAHNYYGKKQCTWWAFKRRAQLGKPVSNRWGNAKNWYSNARRSGYATGHKPRKYAVMQSTSIMGTLKKYIRMEKSKFLNIIIMCH